MTPNSFETPLSLPPSAVTPWTTGKGRALWFGATCGHVRDYCTPSYYHYSILCCLVSVCLTVFVSVSVCLCVSREGGGEPQPFLESPSNDGSLSRKKYRQTTYL